MACLWLAHRGGRPCGRNPPCPALGAPHGRERCGPHLRAASSPARRHRRGAADAGHDLPVRALERLSGSSARIHTSAQLRGDQRYRGPFGRARRLGGSGLLRDRLHAGHARRGRCSALLRGYGFRSPCHYGFPRARVGACARARPFRDMGMADAHRDRAWSQRGEAAPARRAPRVLRRGLCRRRAGSGLRGVAHLLAPGRELRPAAFRAGKAHPIPGGGLGTPRLRHFGQRVARRRAGHPVAGRPDLRVLFRRFRFPGRACFEKAPCPGSRRNVPCRPVRRRPHRGTGPDRRARRRLRTACAVGRVLAAGMGGTASGKRL